MDNTRVSRKRNGERGFWGWEMILVIGLVFAVIAFALFMLRKSYSVCTDQGYSLLECVFNSPAEDPYDKKAEETASSKAGTQKKPARSA